MSLLKTLQKAVLIPSTGFGNLVGQTLDKLGVVKFTPQNVNTLVETGGGKVLSAGILGVSAGLAATIAPAGSAAAVAKSLVPKSVIGKIVAGGTVLTVAQSDVLRKQVLSSDPLGFTGDVADVIDNPSGSSVGDLIKNNPLISSLVGGAIVFSAGRAVLPAAAALATREALNDQTDALERQADAAEALVNKQTNQALPTTTTQTASDSVLPTDTSTISTPATQSISPQKRSRKGARRKVQPSIRQSVRVNVVNTRIGTTSKRYLNYAVIPN